MKAKFSPFVQRTITQIYKKDRKLAKKIQRQIFLFETNPKHPSLRLHKLSGTFDNMWSLSITLSIRMVYRLINQKIAYFVDIGTHDEVYRK
ncbi:type II toxin-antitoxin system mRNA interferase toxin, RelE/StbE family [Candidatus Gottesmanbacteria bacterium]|nr:type II toxin-antitoxin system mRNA interferase toxin, RelE/StbE family [Candidatus Gottesmanbacteria bacterium]